MTMFLCECTHFRITCLTSVYFLIVKYCACFAHDLFSPFTLASQTPTLTKLSMPLIADTIFSSIGDYNSGMQALSCFTSKERVAKTYTYRVYSSLQ